MPRMRNPYAAEFGERLAALARVGRSVESLAREYEPRVGTIHEGVRQEALKILSAPETLQARSSASFDARSDNSGRNGNCCQRAGH